MEFTTTTKRYTTLGFKIKTEAKQVDVFLKDLLQNLN
jgi:hypothetical protein